jgi:hypothetical protein
MLDCYLNWPILLQVHAYKFSQPSFNIRKIKGGIQKYVRQSSQDRIIRECKLRITFHFKGWLSILENSVVEEVSLDFPLSGEFTQSSKESGRDDAFLRAE